MKFSNLFYSLGGFGRYFTASGIGIRCSVIKHKILSQVIQMQHQKLHCTMLTLWQSSRLHIHVIGQGQSCVRVHIRQVFFFWKERAWGGGGGLRQVLTAEP